MKSNRLVECRALLLAATSLAVFAAAAPAQAQIYSIPDWMVPEAHLDIVANHEVTPGPGAVNTGANYGNSPQILDLAGSINGVGQQIAFVQASPTAAGLSLCSGTLINPRTVITAAHCVNARPAHMYGSQTGSGGGVNGNFGAITGFVAPTPTNPTGVTRALVTSQGVPLSFGFKSTNRCQGITPGVNAAPTAAAVVGNGCQAETGAYEVWRNSGFRTNEALAIYNANQVWYLPYQATEFANGDIALVTLDTHAKGVPTWTMLFSPLDGPVHATITGYGGTGVGLSGIGSLAGIDYRRRSAENMIDALFTLHEWRTSDAIGGNNAWAAWNHPIYWLDFDDPDHDPNNLPANFFTNVQPGPNPPRNNGYYDFNGLGGVTLPNEGATAGGDSGGPLIVDQRWNIPVIAGVLTGSISFNGGLSTYGQFNVYPPLFNFWEDIVQNNPYKYVSALAGNGDWFDSTHWLQDMDPNYVTIAGDGSLANVLPDNPQGSSDGGVADKFGELCWVDRTSCTNYDGPGSPAGDGVPHYTANGPGTTNFVPNNVEPVNSANAALHVKARYYDVTLREAGTTTLSGTATIDKMTVNGAGSKLKIATGGTLNTWADFTQVIGWTQVDGTLNTNEMVVGLGLLSGRGTINADFLTVIGGAVAPGGGDSVGTLTVNSDMILASASAYFVDVTRNSADLLDVSGVLALSGGSIVFNKVTDAAAPRHGTKLSIAHADLGVVGTFGTAYTFQGVLRPHLTYDADDVFAEFRAGSLVEILDGGSATELAFASALDLLRTNSYTSLWNLYGAVDWMNPGQLSMTFNALSPKIIGETQRMQDNQSKTLMTTISDRLSLLGTGRATGMTLAGGTVSILASNRSVGGLNAAQRLGISGGASSGGTTIPLANGMTGFVTGGIDQTRTSYGDNGRANAGRRGWHGGFGLEMPISDKGTLGTAIGYAEGASNANSDRSQSSLRQAAAYASYSLGRGAYLGGIVAADMATADVHRLGYDGVSTLSLTGATRSTRYAAMAEAGWRKEIGRGLALTPRAQFGYSHYSLRGFNEQGGGETALQIDDITVDRIETRFGAKLDGTTKLGGWTVRPQIQADYVRLLAGAQTDATVRFASAPEFGFALPLTSGGTGWTEVKGGVEFGRGAFTLGLNGQATVGNAPIVDQRGAIDLTLRF